MYSLKTNAPISIDNNLSGFQFGNRKQNNKQKAKELGLLGIQAKLRVGSVDEPAEKEADLMADQFMLLAIDQFIRNLHCILGVSSVHSDDEN